jgi:hypothetical protein
MGQVSKKLRSRFGKLASRVKQQLAKEVAPLRPPKGVKDVPTLVKEGHDPIHSVYVHVQNITSVFAENVSVLPELSAYYKIVEKAEDEYMPAGPPMSPLTRSYFTTWAFFDVRFGPDKETMGTCLIDLADLLDMDPRIVEATRELQQSRMGIYEHLGSAGGRCRLRELITDREFICYCTSGYVGRPGELWYVRVCPPLWGLADYWVTLTTPYVFVEMSKADWVAYLNRAMLQVKAKDDEKKLQRLMKYGLSTNHWNEYIFLAYVNHQHDAIFLTGIPDVKGSLPHA